MHTCLHLDDVIIPWETILWFKYFWILDYNTSL